MYYKHKFKPTCTDVDYVIYDYGSNGYTLVALFNYLCLHNNECIV